MAVSAAAPRRREHPAVSFDHLVCAEEDRGRDRDAEPARRLEIDDQSEPRRQLDRQIAGLIAFQDFAHVRWLSSIL
jgi:hypothetical protein